MNIERWRRRLSEYSRYRPFFRNSKEEFEKCYIVLCPYKFKSQTEAVNFAHRLADSFQRTPFMAIESAFNPSSATVSVEGLFNPSSPIGQL